MVSEVAVASISCLLNHKIDEIIELDHSSSSRIVSGFSDLLNPTTIGAESTFSKVVRIGQLLQQRSPKFTLW